MGVGLEVFGIWGFRNRIGHHERRDEQLVNRRLWGLRAFITDLEYP